jgi:hypothetical protein
MKKFTLWSSLITAGLFLVACGDDTTNSYKVSLKNLTYSQPLSPMIVSYHRGSEQLFALGEEVDVSFEMLVEGGDNSTLMKDLNRKKHISSVVGGNGVIPPSKTDSVVIKGRPTDCISMASMLVNTNDAFIGSNCLDVSSLGVGQKIVVDLLVYDAGTESNLESSTTIPGPAGGGEGFNPKRDDNNFVTIHPNVVTKDDGLSGSVLTQEHKWDNPAAELTIERI